MEGERKVKISIVAPAYNEAENIEYFYAMVLEVIKQIPEITDYEFVFTNDGSKDNTLTTLLGLNRKDTNVKVLDLSRNFGKEIALSAGLDHSTGDIVIPIDVDLQDPPEVIYELFAKWKEGYEVVYAVRKAREGETWVKRITSFLFYWVISKITRIDIPRNTGDFRLIDKKVIDALKEVRETQRFMKGLFAWVGYKSTGVEYLRSPRYKGKTKWNYRKLVGLAMEGITSFSIIPLRLSFFTGVAVSFFSFFYGMFLIVRKLVFGNDTPGYTSLMVVILFASGIQLLSIGLIGEYLGRTYVESKNRPLYFVRNKIGF